MRRARTVCRIALFLGMILMPLALALLWGDPRTAMPAPKEPMPLVWLSERTSIATWRSALEQAAHHHGLLKDRHLVLCVTADEAVPNLERDLELCTRAAQNGRARLVICVVPLPQPNGVWLLRIKRAVGDVPVVVPGSTDVMLDAVMSAFGDAD